jgi:hypothetical protein
MANDINIVVSAQVGDATRGLMQVQKQVQQVDRQIKQSTVALKQNANQFNSTAVATNKFAKGALQQAGYQVGDFAVQVSGGQNALMAFGQQGSQLAGVFGPMGAVVGAGIAIVAAFGVAIQKTTGIGVDFNKTLEETNTAIKSYIDLASSASDRAKDFYTNAQLMAESSSGVLRELIQIERLKAFESIMDLNTAIYRTVGPTNMFHKSLNESTTALLGIGNTSSRARDRINEVVDSFISLRRASNLEESFAAATQLRDQFTAIVGPIEGMNSSQREFYENLLLSIQKMELLGAAVNSTQSLGVLLKDVISDIKIEMDGAASSADLMAKRMLESARAFMRVQLASRQARVQAAVDVANQRSGGGRGGAQGAGSTDIERILMAMGGEDVGKTKTASAVGRATTVAKEAARAVDMHVSPSFLRLQSIQEEVSSGIESGFMSMVDGTKSVKDAFRSMASEIIKELYRIFVVKRITGMISGFIGGMSGVGMTNAPAVNPLQGLSGSQMLPARAMGGQVTGGRPYMVGERGPEMIVPQRNGNVVPNNQLGGGGVTVNQTINVSTGVQQTVRAEIKTLMPQIAEASKAAVADAVRRGGSYGRAFA